MLATAGMPSAQRTRTTEDQRTTPCLRATAVVALIPVLVGELGESCPRIGTDVEAMPSQDVVDVVVSLLTVLKRRPSVAVHVQYNREFYTPDSLNQSAY